jgi:hypothetical protein
MKTIMIEETTINMHGYTNGMFVLILQIENFTGRSGFLVDVTGMDS